MFHQLLDFYRKTKPGCHLLSPISVKEVSLTGVNEAISHLYNTFRSRQLNVTEHQQHNTLKLLCSERHYHCEHIYRENSMKVMSTDREDHIEYLYQQQQICLDLPL